jgi:hypothetical protein
MSCDNFLPLVIAKSHAKEWLKVAFIKVLKRCFFMWNFFEIWPSHIDKEENNKKLLPDFGGPALLLAFMRSFGYRILYPIVLLLDLWLLGYTLLMWILKNPGDSLNLGLLVIQSRRSLKTPISYLAAKVYKRYGQSMWDKYFESEDAPPLNEYIKPLIKDL